MSRNDFIFHSIFEGHGGQMPRFSICVTLSMLGRLSVPWSDGGAHICGFGSSETSSYVGKSYEGCRVAKLLEIAWTICANQHSKRTSLRE